MDAKKNISIVIVEPEKMDSYIAKTVFKTVVDVSQITEFDSEKKAFEHIKATDYPAESTLLILLTFNPYSTDGDFSLQNSVATLPESKRSCLKLYMVSTMIDQKEIERILKHHTVSGYICKPFTIERAKSLIK